jgi:hypothetical protein
MSIFINELIETNEDDKNQKMSFSNSIVLDTFHSIEKEIKNNNISNKENIILNRNPKNKDYLSDIESTGNNSDKLENRTINFTESNNNLNKIENNRYLDDENKDKISNENINVRKDIFGTEIKKGGKHKISFADNVQVLKARMKLEKENNQEQKSLEVTNWNSDKRIRKIRGLRRSLIGLKNTKLKSRFNIESPKKKGNNNLVEVIEIQSYKQYNKNEFLNSLDEENNTNKETVCCSSTCFIF